MQIEQVNKKLSEKGLEEFFPLDLKELRAAREKELKETKKKNAEIRAQNEKGRDEPDFVRKDELPLPDIFRETLKHLEDKKMRYNEKIETLNGKYGLTLPLLDFKTVTLDNYWRDPVIIERALWDLKNFRLFYVDIMGNLHMHNILPVDYQDGGFEVHYRGLKGLPALELMGQKVRSFFGDMDTIPDSMEFRRKMWDELGEIFKIVNSWYSDKEAHAKAVAVKKFIEEGGLDSFGSGILGRTDQAFVDRESSSFIIWGHNERKKFSSSETRLPWLYLYPGLESGIANIDYEMSEGYSDRGSVLTFFKRDNQGRVTGMRLWGYEKGSDHISDLTLTDVEGLNPGQKDMLKELAGGDSFMKWYRNKALRQNAREAELLIQKAREEGRPDKENFAAGVLRETEFMLDKKDSLASPPDADVLWKSAVELEKSFKFEEAADKYRQIIEKAAPATDYQSRAEQRLNNTLKLIEEKNAYRLINEKALEALLDPGIKISAAVKEKLEDYEAVAEGKIVFEAEGEVYRMHIDPVYAAHCIEKAAEAASSWQHLPPHGSYESGGSAPFIEEDGDYRQATMADMENALNILGNYSDIIRHVTYPVKVVAGKDSSNAEVMYQTARKMEKILPPDMTRQISPQDMPRDMFEEFMEEFPRERWVHGFCAVDGMGELKIEDPDSFMKSLLRSAEAGANLSVGSVPMGGVNAPVTPQGLLIQSHAEALFQVVLAQTVNPGAVVIHSAFPSPTRQAGPRELSMAHGTPEHNLVHMALQRLNMWVTGLPSNQSVASTVSRTPDHRAYDSGRKGRELLRRGGFHIIRHAFGFLDNLAALNFSKLKNELEAERERRKEIKKSSEKIIPPIIIPLEKEVSREGEPSEKVDILEQAMEAIRRFSKGASVYEDIYNFSNLNSLNEWTELNSDILEVLDELGSGEEESYWRRWSSLLRSYSERNAEKIGSVLKRKLNLIKKTFITFLTALILALPIGASVPSSAEAFTSPASSIEEFYTENVREEDIYIENGIFPLSLEGIEKINVTDGFSAYRRGYDMSWSNSYNIIYEKGDYFSFSRPHLGIDVFAPAGTEVLSVLEGRVVSVKNSTKGDGWALVRNNDGNYAFYVHINIYPGIRPGREVEMGEALGVLSDHSLGRGGERGSPHLHFEIALDWPSYSARTTVSPYNTLIHLAYSSCSSRFESRSREALDNVSRISESYETALELIDTRENIIRRAEDKFASCTYKINQIKDIYDSLNASSLIKEEEIKALEKLLQEYFLIQDEMESLLKDMGPEDLQDEISFLDSRIEFERENMKATLRIGEINLNEVEYSLLKELKEYYSKLDKISVSFLTEHLQSSSDSLSELKELNDKMNKDVKDIRSDIENLIKAYHIYTETEKIRGETANLQPEALVDKFSSISPQNAGFKETAEDIQDLTESFIQMKGLNGIEERLPILREKAENIGEEVNPELREIIFKNIENIEQEAAYYQSFYRAAPMMLSVLEVMGDLNEYSSDDISHRIEMFSHRSFIYGEDREELLNEASEIREIIAENEVALDGIGKKLDTIDKIKDTSDDINPAADLLIEEKLRLMKELHSSGEKDIAELEKILQEVEKEKIEKLEKTQTRATILAGSISLIMSGFLLFRTLRKIKRLIYRKTAPGKISSGETGIPRGLMPVWEKVLGTEFITTRPGLSSLTAVAGENFVITALVASAGLLSVPLFGTVIPVAGLFALFHTKVYTDLKSAPVSLSSLSLRQRLSYYAPLFGLGLSMTAVTAALLPLGGAAGFFFAFSAGSLIHIIYNHTVTFINRISGTSFPLGITSFSSQKAELEKADIKLGKEIGHGTASFVYKALVNGRERALKAYMFTMSDMKEAVKEHSILEQLSGVEGVVEAAGPLVEFDRGPALVMEYVKGENIRDFFRLDTPDESDISEIALRLVNTVREIHQAGYSHNDLNPRNIIVNRLPEGDLNYKIIDFGASTRMYETEGAYGHPSYIAPELIPDMGEHFISEKSDMYSLGRVLSDIIEDHPDYPGLRDELVAVAGRSGETDIKNLKNYIEDETRDSIKRMMALFMIMSDEYEDRRPDWGYVQKNLEIIFGQTAGSFEIPGQMPLNLSGLWPHRWLNQATFGVANIRIAEFLETAALGGIVLLAHTFLSRTGLDNNSVSDFPVLISALIFSFFHSAAYYDLRAPPRKTSLLGRGFIFYSGLLISFIIFTGLSLFPSSPVIGAGLGIIAASALHTAYNKISNHNFLKNRIKHLRYFATKYILGPVIPFRSKFARIRVAYDNIEAFVISNLPSLWREKLDIIESDSRYSFLTRYRLKEGDKKAAFNILLKAKSVYELSGSKEDFKSGAELSIYLLAILKVFQYYYPEIINEKKFKNLRNKILTRARFSKTYNYADASFSFGVEYLAGKSREYFIATLAHELAHNIVVEPTVGSPDEFIADLFARDLLEKLAAETGEEKSGRFTRAIEEHKLHLGYERAALIKLFVPRDWEEHNTARASLQWLEVALEKKGLPFKTEILLSLAIGIISETPEMKFREFEKELLARYMSYLEGEEKKPGFLDSINIPEDRDLREKILLPEEIYELIDYLGGWLSLARIFGISYENLAKTFRVGFLPFDPLEIDNNSFRSQIPDPEGVPDAIRGRLIQATHWSGNNLLERLDPGKYGSGAAGKEKRRKKEYADIFINRSYFGIPPYRREKNLGSVRYALEINGSRIYDISRDPLNLYPGFDEIISEGYAPFDQGAALTLFEKKIFEKGYDGYLSRRNSAGALFIPVELRSVPAGDESLPVKAKVNLQLKNMPLRASVEDTRPVYEALLTGSADEGVSEIISGISYEELIEGLLEYDSSEGSLDPALRSKLETLESVAAYVDADMKQMLKGVIADSVSQQAYLSYMESLDYDDERLLASQIWFEAMSVSEQYSIGLFGALAGSAVFNDVLRKRFKALGSLEPETAGRVMEQVKEIQASYEKMLGRSRRVSSPSSGASAPGESISSPAGSSGGIVGIISAAVEHLLVVVRAYDLVGRPRRSVLDYFRLQGLSRYLLNALRGRRGTDHTLIQNLNAYTDMLSAK